MTFVKDLKEKYPSLSKTQIKIADYVTENPETACFLSVRDLAKKLETTEATIFKFVKKIGYASYNEFKKNLQEQIQHWISPNERIGQAMSNLSEEGDATYQEIVKSEVGALRSTFANIKYETLRQTIALLAKAKKVYVVGNEVSKYIAQFAAFRLHQVGRQAEFLPVDQRRTTANCLAGMDEDTAFIVISFPIYSVETLALANCLNEKGIRYIAISDRHSSEVAINAAVSLVCSNEDVVFYNSITSAISLVNMICSLLAVEMRADLDKFRAQSDLLLNTLDNYVAKKR